MTQLVAKKLVEERFHEIPPLMWTALSLMTLMGVLGAVVLSLCCPGICGLGNFEASQHLDT
jgi:hypothetical protein